MQKEFIDKIVQGIGTAIQEGANKSAQYSEPVAESIKVVGKRIEEQGQEFESMKKRVRQKLNSGARRTHGDPV